MKKSPPEVSGGPYLMGEKQMQWLEMHNVEFGECIVIGGSDNSILMVDCGSMNHKIRENEMEVSDYIQQYVMPRYRDIKERSFLLTHFHRDHMAGFRQIIKHEPQYFQRIYLPMTPVDENGRALLIEFAVYVFAFLGRQSEYSQMSVGALRIFERLHGILGADAITTVGRGRSFSFDGVTYDVLWPSTQNYPFSSAFTDIVEELDICLSSPFLGKNASVFLQLKHQFSQEYIHCCEILSGERHGDIAETEASIERLKNLLDAIEELIDSLLLLPAAQDVLEILERPAVRAEYSYAQNAASVIFQNRRVREGSFDDILMTGDATPETFDEIGGDLYDGYYIFKAPHHGTQGYWSDLFSDILKQHILISNGDYHAAGLISLEYPQEEKGIKHCTNPSACQWMNDYGRCCNRIAYCYEASAHGSLTLKCPKCITREGDAGCRIYLISYGKDKGCFCDD